MTSESSSCASFADVSRPSFPSPQERYAIFWLIRLGIFFPLLCNQPLVRHWAVTSMLYHSTWLYSERTWQRSAALPYRRSPFQPFLSAARLSVLFWIQGAVECIIYPLLPPRRGEPHKKWAFSLDWAPLTLPERSQSWAGATAELQIQEGKLQIILFFSLKKNVFDYFEDRQVSSWFLAEQSLYTNCYFRDILTAFSFLNRTNK